MRKLLAGSLPISLLRFLFRSLEMPASKELTTPTAVRESVPSALPSAPVVPWWECDGPSGPADLYKAFAFTAVEQILKDRGEAAEDGLFEIIFEYVEIAVNVVLKAAAVPESWQSQYEAATADLTQ